MAELKVQVVIDRSKFDKGISSLEADIKKLESRKISIQIETGELGKLSKSVLAVAKAQAQAEAAAQKAAAARSMETAAALKAAEAETRLAIAKERSKQVTAQSEAAIVRESYAVEHLAIEKEKTAQTSNRLAAAQERTRNALKKTSEQATVADKTLSALGNRVKEVFLLGNALNHLQKAFGEALSTMKEVDSELTTIRKVTGMSADEMDALAGRAYKVASAYGQAANEYLVGVENFARAGYGKQSEALGELAIKTQMVGDTTSAIANQFLLAVDAAYGYEGSVRQLSAVLDGANAIDNKYATSIEKIAAGMGKVAPIASQAHVSVAELSAALGTITAVTQRSGSEAATALRALFLNIMGDTKTEIEDGAKWTAGEIAGLRDLLNLYAADVVKAADATGSLINPMEAIGALAKSYKDGILTEQKLMAMVTDIGGKLRSSQLLALIQNWDMYNSMLNTVAESAGSADAEISMMLTSWKAKTNVLSNTWTEFVAKTADSDLFKGAIDGATWLLKSFDSLGGLLPTVTGLLLAACAPAIAQKFLGLASAVRTLAINFTTMSKAAGAGAAFKSLLGGMGGLQLGILGVTAAITAATMVYNNYQNALREAEEAAKKAASESLNEAQAANDSAQNLLTLVSSYEAAQRGSGDLTTASNALQTALENEGVKVNNLASEYKSLTAEKLKAAQTDAINAVSDARNAIRAINWSDNAVKIKIPGAGNATPIAGLTRDFYREMESFGVDKNAFKAWSYGNDSVRVFPADRTPEGVLKSYKEAQKYVNAIEKASNDAALAGNQDLADNYKRGSYYVGMKQYVDSIDEEVTSLQKAEEAKSRANAQLDAYSANISDQSAFDAYIDGIDAANDKTEEQKEIWKQVAGQMYPEYTKSVEQTGAAQDEAAERTDEWSQSVRGSIDRLNALRDAQESGKVAMEGNVKYVDLNDDAFNKLIDSGVKLTDKNGELVDGVYQLGDGYRINADVLDELTDEEMDFLKKQGLISETVKASAEEIIAMADAALTLRDDLQAATNALSAYNSAVQAGEKGETLTAMAKAYESAMTMFEKGMVGSTQFQAAADMLLGTDVMASLGYDYQKAGELMGSQFFQAFMTSGGDNFGQSALQYLVSEWGDILGDNGEIIASFEEIDGAISWAVNDVDALAQALGVAPALVEALIDAWSVFNGELPATKDEIENLLTAMNTARDGMTVDLDSFAKGLKDAGKTESDITKLASAMQNLGYIFDGVDAEGLADAVKTATQTVSDETDDENTIVISYDDSAVETGVSNTDALIKTLPDGKTVTIRYKTVGAPYYAHASGTKDAPGGPTLVNELGPELISDNGRAYIAGDGSPTLVNLSPHAIVFNAGQTRQIARGIDLTGGIHAAAYGQNNFMQDPAGGGRPFSGTVPLSGTTPTAPTKPTGGSGGAAQDATDWWEILTHQVNQYNSTAQNAMDNVEYSINQLQYAMEDATEPYKEQIEVLEEQNELLDRQAELLERERKNAVKPLQDQIDALKAAKEVEDDQLKIEEAKQAVLSAQAALQNAQNERTIRFYNKEKQQWEWMADQKKIQEAQDALANAEKNLSDAEYDQKIKDLERQRDAINADYEKQIQAIRDQQTAIDDQIYNLNQVLDGIEDAYKDLMRPLEDQLEQMKRALEAIMRVWENINFAHEHENIDIQSVLNGLSGDAQFPQISSMISAMQAMYPSAFGAGSTSAGQEYVFNPPEIVLPWDEMQSILQTGAGSTMERAQNMGVMFGATGYGGNPAPKAIGAGGVTNNNTGDTYYINGMKIGSDQADMPLSRLVKTIPLYTGGV